MRHKIIISFSLLAAAAFGETTIDGSAPYAYSANTGWINAAGNSDDGAVVGQAFCSGYMYSANCGWICLGDGDPDDHVAYGNDSATDFGVNHDGQGNLTGTAYGANIGWINFEQTYGRPKVDLETGELSGYVWSANIGWINLNSGSYGVVTKYLDSGPDSDADGIPDWWEYDRYGKLAALTAVGDWDKDGVSDLDEYMADTHPNDDSDYLVITDFQSAGETNRVSWTVKNTRRYTLEHALALTNSAEWIEDVSLVPSSGAEYEETVSGVTDAARFYRVTAAPPLSP